MVVNHAEVEHVIDSALPDTHDGRPVLFMIGRGGGGHKASAVAVRDCLREQGVRWAPNVEILDAGELAEAAIHGWAVGCMPSGDDIYNLLMVWGMYNIAGLSGSIARSSVRSNHDALREAFGVLFRQRKPALVVSFMPFLNEAMRESLATECPGINLVTVVTDMASCSAHLWIPPRQAASNHYIVTGNTVLEAQAREAGYEGWILRTSGMVVHPSYYSLPTSAESDAAAGERPKVVVFFGAFAPERRTEQIVRNAVRSHPQLDFVVICGHNARLKSALDDVPNCLLEGFIPASRIREHLAGATCVLGKPGPGSVSEAGVCRVPFVADRQVMPQEECVLKWLETSGTGVIMDSLDQLPVDLLDRVEACRQVLETGLVENRAVFEVCYSLCELVLSPGHENFVGAEADLFPSLVLSKEAAMH